MIKNYTSSVPVSQTIARIESLLIACGVIGIAKEYSPTRQVVAITFGMPHEGRNIAVRLPVEVDACQEALYRDYISGEPLKADGSLQPWSRKRKPKADFRDQAERTAWKLAQDWLEVELSRVQLKQGNVAQVFMAYIWDGRRKQTLFQQFQENGGFKQLPERTEAVAA